MIQSEQKAPGSWIARGGAIFAALLFAFYCAVILAHRLPPLLGDLPSWDAAGMMFAWHLRGLPDAAHFLKTYPVPNAAIVVLPGLLCLVFSPPVAAKVFLLLYLLLVFLSMRAVMKAAGTDPVMWWIVPSACFLGLNFWLGSEGFLLGIGLLLFFVVALIRREESSHREWVLGVLLAALFLTHMVPYTFALLLLLLYVLQFGRWRLLRQAIPSLVLLVWYVVGRFSSGNVDSSAARTQTANLYGGTFWIYKLNTFFKSFGFVNPSTNDLQHSAAHAVLGSGMYLLVFAANIMVCIALMIFLLLRGIDVARERPYIWLAVFLCIPAYLLVPMSLLGISDPGDRILQTAVFALLLVFPAGLRRSQSLRAIAAGSVAMAVAGAVLFATLCWRADVPQAKRAFPRPVEQLGKVPYSGMRGFLPTLDKGYTDIFFFATSVLRNRY